MQSLLGIVLRLKDKRNTEKKFINNSKTNAHKLIAMIKYIVYIFYEENSETNFTSILYIYLTRSYNYSEALYRSFSQKEAIKEMSTVIAFFYGSARIIN